MANLISVLKLIVVVEQKIVAIIAPTTLDFLQVGWSWWTCSGMRLCSLFTVSVAFLLSHLSLQDFGLRDQLACRTSCENLFQNWDAFRTNLWKVAHWHATLEQWQKGGPHCCILHCRGTSYCREFVETLYIFKKGLRAPVATALSAKSKWQV